MRSVWQLLHILKNVSCTRIGAGLFLLQAAIPIPTMLQAETLAQEATRPAVLNICTQLDATSRGFVEVRQDEPVRASLKIHPALNAHTSMAQLRCGVAVRDSAPISIRRRGFSSRKFAKKQYGFTYLEPDGNDTSVSPLGMPAGSDWALHGPYIDRSYLRNALAYTIGWQMGRFGRQAWFAPQFRFVELFLNNDYKGLYVLTERIEPHKNQLDLPKIELENPDKLHFILEVSLRSPDVKTRYGTSLEYSYPGPRKLRKWQAQNPEAAEAIRRRIIGEVEAFEASLLALNFAHPSDGYRTRVDMPSFVDYFIAQEVFKNIDGFRRSAFFYKGRDERLHMGPLWDFDLAFGNLNFWGMSYPEAWVHEDRGLPPKPLFWFNRMLADPHFNRLVRERYVQLRQAGAPLHGQVLDRHLARLGSLLGRDAPLRDARRWLGTYNHVHANVFNTLRRGSHHHQHVAILRDWLLARLNWLDHHMPLLARKAKPGVSHE